ncbi:hypothetical protein BOW51_09920, partial [Solemya velesiana gill symbiont]
LKLWSVREATYATAAYPLTNSVELHLEIEFAFHITRAWISFLSASFLRCSPGAISIDNQSSKFWSEFKQVELQGK